MSEDRPRGTDTPTGTDPDAKWNEPGYEDKSLGQAVEQDSELADELLQDSGGDQAEAGRRFEEKSHGSEARERQGRPETS